MKIKVNGVIRTFSRDGSLTELIDSLGLNPHHLVVELNRKVVQRDSFDATKLQEDDQVELIEFVAGG